MAELIKEQPAGILDRREWWSLSNSYEAMVVYGKDYCSIHITNQNREDVSRKVAEKLKKQTGVFLRTTATIDSFFIECRTEDVSSLISILDTVS